MKEALQEMFGKEIALKIVDGIRDYLALDAVDRIQAAASDDIIFNEMDQFPDYEQVASAGVEAIMSSHTPAGLIVVDVDQTPIPLHLSVSFRGLPPVKDDLMTNKD